MKLAYFGMILVFAGGLLFFGCLEPQPPVVNNGSECAVGYSWCGVLQKCIKLEENCTVDGTVLNCGFAGCPPIGNYSNISNFDECVAAGYPILKTNPPRCETPDNKTFVQNQTYLMNQSICETGRGHWINCSTTCENETGICTEYRCIPYCECGGLAGFRCPENFYCTDYYPEWTSDAVGICRPISELIDEGK